jgi:hypothetical protein
MALAADARRVPGGLAGYVAQTEILVAQLNEIVIRSAPDDHPGSRAQTLAAIPSRWILPQGDELAERFAQDPKLAAEIIELKQATHDALYQAASGATVQQGWPVVLQRHKTAIQAIRRALSECLRFFSSPQIQTILTKSPVGKHGLRQRIKLLNEKLSPQKDLQDYRIRVESRLNRMLELYEGEKNPALAATAVELCDVTDAHLNEIDRLIADVAEVFQVLATNEVASELPGTNSAASPPAKPADPIAPPTKPKRSTQPGEAREKIVGALTKWHKYESGSCLNSEPVGVRQLSRLAAVAPATVSDFFDENFERGLPEYRSICNSDVRKLADSIEALRGETTPAKLLTYGRRPPGEGRDDE